MVNRIFPQLRDNARHLLKSFLKTLDIPLHPKMPPHTKVWIPTVNSIAGMLRTRCEDPGAWNGQCDQVLMIGYYICLPLGE